MTFLGRMSPCSQDCFSCLMWWTVAALLPMGRKLNRGQIGGVKQHSRRARIIRSSRLSQPSSCFRRRLSSWHWKQTNKQKQTSAKFEVGQFNSLRFALVKMFFFLHLPTKKLELTEPLSLVLGARVKYILCKVKRTQSCSKQLACFVACCAK